MSFGDAVRTCYSKYATFDGRAGRPEFWWFYLWTLLPSLLIYLVAAVAGQSDGGFSGLGIALIALAVIWSLANIIPLIAVSVRRLHDTDRSGWWFWIQLVPCGIGTVWFLVLMILEGTPGPNRYGAA